MATYEDAGDLGKNSYKLSENSDTWLSCDEPLSPLPALLKSLMSVACNER